MKSLINSFFLQIQFMTRIPLPFKTTYTPENLGRGFLFSPVIGWIIGGTLLGVSRAAALLESPGIEAFFILLVHYFLTGGLHMDGFADTCDGLACGGDKKRSLEVMRDSRTGAFGVIGLLFLLGARWLFLSAPGMRETIWVITFPVISRLNVIVSGTIGPYARKTGGLGENAVKGAGGWSLFFGGLLTFLPLGIAGQIAPLLPWIVTLVYTIFFTLYLRKRLGGVTGDTLGYIIEVTETLYLGSAFLYLKFGGF